jgi:Protein phosphatase 2C
MHKSSQRSTPHPSPHLVWQCQGSSVLGASHHRSGLPNQDAIAWSPETGAGPPIILAIADGHGSAKSFRSHHGSKLAVQVAIREIEKAFQLRPGTSLPALSQAEAIAAQLPQSIVQRWQQLVQAELQSQPIVSSEWEHLQNKEGLTACGRVEKQPLLAYGSTLLTVLITDTFILFMQLGDGDILCVDAQGQVSQPLVKDSRLIANETTSLCQDNAWKSMQWQVMPISESELPELILLSTDGYANCFVTEADFQQIGPDYQQMLREQGLAQVMGQLPTILQHASQRGSGDDITLGLIQRLPSQQSQRSVTASPANTISPAKTQVKRSPSAAFATQPVIPNPTTADRLATSDPLATSDLLQTLQQQNQQQHKEISRLKFWLNILLLTTLVSLLLAALSFWRLHASTRPPNPTSPPQPTPATAAASPSGRQSQSPLGSPSSNPATNLTTPSEWLLQVRGQAPISLKPDHHLVNNLAQRQKISLEKLFYLGPLVLGCQDCKPLAEIATQNNRLVLKNISGNPWLVTQPNQPQSQTVADQAEISLQAKMQIDFGDSLRARIEQHLQTPPSTQPNSSR